MIKAENETIQRDIYRKSENNENVFIKLNSDRSIDDSTILFRIETEIEGAYYLGKKFSNVEGTQNAQN